MAILPARSHVPPASSPAFRWVPAAVAILVFVQIFEGGANNGVASAVASFADAVVVLVILIMSPAKSRFWRRGRWPLFLFATTFLWAALPVFLPNGLAQTLGIPANPAADMVGLAFAKSQATILLLLGSATFSYRTGSARRVVRWLTWAAMVYSVYAAVDAVEWLTDTARATRYSGTIGNPNAAGIVFATIAILTGGLVLAPDDEPPALRFAALTSSALSLVLCALTGSRSAFLLAVIFGGVLLAWRGRRWQDGPPRLRLVGFTALALLLLMIVVAFLTPVADRTGYLPGDAASRWSIVTHFTEVANEQPVWGHGLGSFFEVNRHALTADTAPLYWNFGAAHIAPVQVAIETGWPGLIFVAIAFAMIAGQIFAARGDWWSIAPLCAVGAIAGSAFVDIALNVPAIAALAAILLGAVWGASLASGSAPRRRSPQRVSNRHRRTAHDINKPVVETPV